MMSDTPPENTAGSQIRQAKSFGLVFSIFFGILAAWPLLDHKPIRLWASIFVVILVFLSLALPSALIPLSRQWLRLGALLHQITSPIIMGILFFLILTPISLLLRAWKYQTLSLSFDPKIASYWIKREPKDADSENMRNQF